MINDKSKKILITMPGAMYARTESFTSNEQGSRERLYLRTYYLSDKDNLVRTFRELIPESLVPLSERER